MRRLRICLNLTILVLPLLFIGVGAVRLVNATFQFLNSNRRLAGTMSAEATRALGREVRIGDVRITGNLWSIDAANRIDLINIFVANGPLPDERAFAQAHRVAVWYNLAQVLAGDRPHVPLVDEIRIDGPEFLLQRSRTGHWNYQDLLKPPSATARPLTDKISFTSGTLFYADDDFPHPAGVPQRPLNARFTALKGIVLIRPDKSYAFNVAGDAPFNYLKEFHASGSVVPAPLRVQAHVAATQVYLPALAERLTPPEQLHVTQGRANLDVGVLYIPPIGTPRYRLDTKALIAHGTLQLFDASASGKMVYAPAEHVNGLGTFTTDSVLGNLSGTYAGMPVRLDGAILGVTFPPLGQGQHAAPPAAPPTVSVRAEISSADWSRVNRLAFMPMLLARVPQTVRADLAMATFRGDVQVHVAGPVNDPEASVSGHVARASYLNYSAEDTDLRGAYRSRTLYLSVKGKYAGGQAIVRGSMALDPPGTFEAEVHGRQLDLAHASIPSPPTLTGTAQLDLAIRGRRDRTPSITAQAEVNDVTVNGQAISHAYATADTVGPNLVVRNFTAEDPKGFVFATGTVGMKSRKLNLTVDADELDFGTIAKALLPKDAATKNKKLAAHPAANSALHRLADIQGFGYARTHVGGTVDDPSMEGQVYAFGVQVGAVELDKVTLTDLKVSREELRLDGVASRYPGQVHVAGSVLQPFAHTPELRLETRADNLDLNTLMQLAGVNVKDLSVTGVVSTDNIPVRGTLSSPQTPDFFTANLQDASINGIPIRNAAITMRYQVEGVYVKNASAALADGVVVGSGWLPFDGPLDVTIHGGGLSLQPLEEAMVTSDSTDFTPITFRGDLNFDARVSGTLKQPVLTAQSIKTDDLTYSGFKIGSVSATASYADRKARIDRLVLTPPPSAGAGPAAVDGPITIDGLSYDLDTKAIRTDPGKPIRVESLQLERVRDLAFLLTQNGPDNVRSALDQLGKVEGPLSATVALGGTLDQPQANVTWKATDLLVKGYQLASVTGSAYIDKTKIVYPSPQTPNQKFRIDSTYVDLQSPSDTNIGSIVIGFDHDGRRGQITTTSPAGVSGSTPADISINNIKLDFLQQILDPRIVSKVEGIGNVDITAQGPTTSPRLDFTASFRNIAVHSALDLKSPITVDHLELLQGSVDEGLISIGSVRALKANPASATPFEASASARLKGFTYEPPFLPDTSLLSLKAGVSVAFLAAAVPSLLDQASRGDIAITADVLSPREHQTVTGQVDLNIPRLETPAAATGLQDLIARFKLANDRLTVDSFTGHTYIFGRPKGVEPEDAGRLATRVNTVAGTVAPQPAAKPARARPATPRKPQPVIAENDPKRKGSEIRLTGSIPLGFKNDRTTGQDDGIVVRVFDPNEDPADAVGGAPAASKRKPAAKVAYTFNEDPIPGGRTGILRGTIQTDTQRPLRIRGSAIEPILSGRVTLYNALITPPAEQKTAAFALPILPSFDLALRLGRDVRMQTSQLNALLFTNRDIEAHGRLLQENSDLTLDGTIEIGEGKLRLPAATFTILPGASIHVRYPTPEAGLPVIGMNVDLKARGFIVATSQAGVRKRYEVTVTARGPLTGDNVDVGTGKSALALSFETNPNDLASSQQVLTERLAGAIIGVDSFDQAGRNPGQAFANVLSGVLTGSVLPGLFDKTAASLGFEELAIGYDPVDRLTLNISRHLFGPLYVSYYRTLTATNERYDLKASFRFKDRYQLSFDLDEQHTQKLLLEGVWKF